jgi:hypothetical protein
VLLLLLLLLLLLSQRTDVGAQTRTQAANKS